MIILMNYNIPDKVESVFSNMPIGKRCTCYETCNDVEYLTYTDEYDAYEM